MTLDALGLRTKILALVVAGFFVICSVVLFITFDRVGNLSSNLTDSAAVMTSQSILDGVSAYGETGDMEGLEIFLKHLGEREDLKSVHVIRSSVTEADFGERSGAKPTDEHERAVLTTGEQVKLIDGDAHSIRLILPSRTVDSCLDCHESAKTGDVLGAVSIVISTQEAEAARSNLGWILIGIFLFGSTIGVIVFYFAIDRIVVMPITNVASSLRKGSDQMLGAAGQLAEEV